MAAGAIPPPLFFEPRRFGGILVSVDGILRNGRGQYHSGKLHQLASTASLDHAI